LKNCWHGRLGIEPTTFDLNSQSGAYDLSAMATPDLKPLLTENSILKSDMISALKLPKLTSLKYIQSQPLEIG